MRKRKRREGEKREWMNDGRKQTRRAFVSLRGTPHVTFHRQNNPETAQIVHKPGESKVRGKAERDGSSKDDDDGD